MPSYPENASRRPPLKLAGVVLQLDLEVQPRFGTLAPIAKDFWPAPFLVADYGASLAPYNHFELGQPILTEYVWGRHVGENTINP